MPARRKDEDEPFLWDVAPPAPAAPEPSATPPARGARPAPAADADETLTVLQVGERIRSLIQSGLPGRFWVVGETVELEQGVRRASARRGKQHWYFKLADGGGSLEHGDGGGHATGGAPRAVLTVKMWETTVRRLFGPRGRLPRDFQPADGMLLRVLVSADFYVPHGEVSLIAEDIDPEFTLGNLDRQRRAVLSRLLAEGALQWNKQVPLPAVPLRLGLVTALDSAACNDVLTCLQASGVGFQVWCCDARMQGEETSRAVRAALASLVARAPDCILLVRGGGSRLDLAWFDREDIARAIATCAVPVLTGIGHETDVSVADAVAHREFKTPTAVAEFLVQCALEARRQTEENWAAIAALAQELVVEERRALLAAASAVRRAAAGRVTAEAAGLAAICQQLRAAAEHRLALAREDLAALRSRLAAGPHVERLAVLRARLAGDGERLVRASAALLDRSEAALVSAADRARLLDPRQVLGRGFAWLRRADGSSLKDAAGAVVGEPLTALLRDGELDLRAGVARPASQALGGNQRDG